jgi:hypothetical protein
MNVEALARRGERLDASSRPPRHPTQLAPAGAEVGTLHLISDKA